MKHNKKIRIRTYQDLRIARERAKYDVKLQEAKIVTRISSLGNNFRASARVSMHELGRKISYWAVKAFIRAKF
jgi:hypothetical protein